MILRAIQHHGQGKQALTNPLTKLEIKPWESTQDFFFEAVNTVSYVLMLEPENILQFDWNKIRWSTACPAGACSLFFRGKERLREDRNPSSPRTRLEGYR